AGMFEGMFGKVTEQFAQGFGAAEAMTINNPIYLLEVLLSSSVVAVRQSHVTNGVTALNI
ncbi:MAG: hypothetical protein WBX08_17585, partial [Candidatus Sulfotelmatobacter sp.]